MGDKEIPVAVREMIESSKAEYKQLGKSGLRVSVPILGAMSFGDARWSPWVLDEEKVEWKGPGQYNSQLTGPSHYPF